MKKWKGYWIKKRCNNAGLQIIRFITFSPIKYCSSADTYNLNPGISAYIVAIGPFNCRFSTRSVTHNTQTFAKHTCNTHYTNCNGCCVNAWLTILAKI